MTTETTSVPYFKLGVIIMAVMFAQANGLPSPTGFSMGVTGAIIGLTISLFFISIKHVAESDYPPLFKMLAYPAAFFAALAIYHEAVYTYSFVRWTF